MNPETRISMDQQDLQDLDRLVARLRINPGSPERTLALRRLQEAAFWLTEDQRLAVLQIPPETPEHRSAQARHLREEATTLLQRGHFQEAAEMEARAEVLEKQA